MSDSFDTPSPFGICDSHENPHNTHPASPWHLGVLLGSSNMSHSFVSTPHPTFGLFKKFLQNGGSRQGDKKGGRKSLRKDVGAGQTKATTRGKNTETLKNNHWANKSTKQNTESPCVASHPGRCKLHAHHDKFTSHSNSSDKAQDINEDITFEQHVFEQRFNYVLTTF